MQYLTPAHTNPKRERGSRHASNRTGHLKPAFLPSATVTRRTVSSYRLISLTLSLMKSLVGLGSVGRLLRVHSDRNSYPSGLGRASLTFRVGVTSLTEPVGASFPYKLDDGDTTRRGGGEVAQLSRSLESARQKARSRTRVRSPPGRECAIMLVNVQLLGDNPILSRARRSRAQIILGWLGRQVSCQSHWLCCRGLLHRGHGIASHPFGEFFEV